MYWLVRVQLVQSTESPSLEQRVEVVMFATVPTHSTAGRGPLSTAMNESLMVTSRIPTE